MTTAPDPAAKAIFWPRWVLALLALLVWTWAALQWGDMPHVGEYHDDALYLIGGKAFASGHGHHLINLPGEPAQTKYPPLYPLWLSLVWRILPAFPENLPLAFGLGLLWVFAWLGLVGRWLRTSGLSPWPRTLALFLLAVNPYTLLFGSSLLTEIPFSVLVLASCFLLARALQRRADPAPLARLSPTHLVLLGALLATAAFYTRTAGLVLLPALSWWLWQAGRRADALRFAALLGSGIFAWVAWSRSVAAPGQDIITLYYTNYLGFHLANLEWSSLHLLLWKNLDGLLHGLGCFVLPKTEPSLLQKILAQTIAVAGLVGLYKNIRSEWPAQGLWRGLAAFSALYALMLLLWSFPPNERFVLPIVPLWMAGLVSELARLVHLIGQQFRPPLAPAAAPPLSPKQLAKQQARQKEQRLAALVLASLASLLFGYSLWQQYLVAAEFLPSFMQRHRQERAALLPLFAWIRGNVSPNAGILADIDPLLYLATGKKSAGLIVHTLPLYQENWDARRQEYARAVDYAKQHGLRLFLLRDTDFSRDMQPEEHQKLMRQLKQTPGLKPLVSMGNTTLFAIP